MNTDLRDARRDYSGSPLPDLIRDPWALFGTWFDEARAEQNAGRLAEAAAMVLATVDPDGQPSSRVVLAKEFGAELGERGGVVFYTGAESRKGRAMQANDRVALLFHWPSLDRQVRLEGNVAALGADDAEAYWARRPHASQLAALVSRQSHERESRASLQAEFDEAAARYAEGTVPRPDEWLGWLVQPHRIEFWQGLPGRLHDRVECVGHLDRWDSRRLDP